MGVNKPVAPISCIVDNMSLHKTCYSENNVSDPTLRRVVAAIQQKITNGIVSLVDWKKSADMLADALTKKRQSRCQKTCEDSSHRKILRINVIQCSVLREKFIFFCNFVC